MSKSPQIRPATVILTATAGLLLSGAVMAKPSTPSQIRGYQTCVDAAEAQTSDMTTTRQYLLKSSAEGREYFINGYQWQDGERVAVRVACSTSTSGRKLHEVAVNEGRYSNQNTRVTIEVAKK